MTQVLGLLLPRRETQSSWLCPGTAPVTADIERVIRCLCLSVCLCMCVCTSLSTFQIKFLKSDKKKEMMAMLTASHHDGIS